MLPHFLKKLTLRPFLCLLLVILGIITLTNIKPDFWLTGWDNYSSYFNLNTNIFRTFFAAWRDSRGVGVPSDGEVTDIFRQLLFFVIKPIVGEKLLDQVYYLFALNIGTIGMYLLGTNLLKYYRTNIKNGDLFSFLAAFFYLFNLNTLATFYFPMVMFVTRFYALPLTFLILLKLIYEKHISRKQYALYVVILFFSTGSYMVPTVFITMVMTVGVFLLFQHNIKRAIAVGFIFLGLNLFWVLPFANYFVQRSEIVTQAPTFIDTNETFTNKSSVYLSAKRQLLVYPQFFDMNFNQTQSGRLLYFHPLANRFDQYPNNFILLYVFPVLYVAGSLILIWKTKLSRQWLWIPSVVFLFLFLSLKEQSPVGFLYTLFSKFIPFFEVIFRFGDTKFHPFIAFAGALAAAVATTYSLERFQHTRRIFVIGLCLIIAIPTIFLYKEYFKGGLVGYFMYNRIPSAYFEMTSYINDDPEPGRVLHLPVDKRNYYWKPYSWGYFGSAFLNFMLDKPLFDKTFEPASMENAYIHEKVNNLLMNTQTISEDGNLDARAQDFYELAKKLNITYIILDKTISVRVHARSIDYWGTITSTDEQTMMAELERRGYIEEVKRYDIKTSDYAEVYKDLYPFTTGDFEGTDGSMPLVLYKVVDPDKRIEFAQYAEQASTDGTTLLRSNMYPLPYRIIEGKDKAVLYPFQQHDSVIDTTNTINTLTLPANQLSPGQYTISLAPADSQLPETQLFEVYASRSAQSVTISLYAKLYPTIGQNTFTTKVADIQIPLASIRDDLTASISADELLNNWHTLDQPILRNLRLRIDGTVLPLPATIGPTEGYVSSLIIRNPTFAVEVLQQESEVPIDLRTFTEVANKDCYNDALDDYRQEVDAEENTLDIKTQYGSTCLTRETGYLMEDLPTHLEFEFDIAGSSESADSIFGYTETETGTKPTLKAVIEDLEKPNHVRICFKQNDLDDCYNTYHPLAGAARHYLLPLHTNIDELYNSQLFIGVRGIGYQKQQVRLANLKAHTFASIQSTEISLTDIEVSPQQVTIDPETPVTLSFGKALNAESYYPDLATHSFTYHNTPCENYRTFRYTDVMLSYVENCENAFLVQLPFSSNNFYIWSVNYNLGSGQYPWFLLEDQFNTYVSERLSLHQGYPDISGFKEFKYPEFWATQGQVQSRLAQLPQKQAYTYVYPHAQYNDNKQKNYYIKQSTENEGLFTMSDYNVIEVPNTWANLEFKKSDSTLEYALPEQYAFRQILPSLWEVKLTTEADKNYLLLFNEGYDAQWGLYDSLIAAWFGGTAAEHYKCEAYANCYELSSTSIGQQTHYIFYWPERLALWGWLLTGGTILVTGWYLRRRRKAD